MSLNSLFSFNKGYLISRSTSGINVPVYISCSFGTNNIGFNSEGTHFLQALCLSFISKKKLLNFSLFRGIFISYLFNI